MLPRRGRFRGPEASYPAQTFHDVLDGGDPLLEARLDGVAVGRG